jgi:formate C-acetyltransferase
MQAPFCSSLLEGPLKQGLDVAEGGCWYNHYGMVLGGVATTGDSLGVIDKLIYRDRKITWDQLLQAMEDNWEGHEELQKLVINGVPKYGNDDEYADQWPAWVMNSFIDCIDYYNNNDRSVVPHYGGKWLGIVTVNSTHVAYGFRVGAMPDGHVYPQPVSDCMSPTQGRDKLGPTAVLKSASKMPIGRFGLGHPLNQKLHPQMVATERDMDNFVAYLKAFQELGINHIQFNIITADLLRKAMQEPDKYRDLMVRVGSYCSYFVELDSNVQLEIINRTEQTQW